MPNHRCDLCHQTLNCTEAEFQQHLISQHPKSAACHKCSLRLKDEGALLDHWNQNHILENCPVTYRCAYPGCDTVLNHLNEFATHNATAHAIYGPAGSTPYQGSQQQPAPPGPAPPGPASSEGSQSSQVTVRPKDNQRPQQPQGAQRSGSPPHSSQTLPLSQGRTHGQSSSSPSRSQHSSEVRNVSQAGTSQKSSSSSQPSQNSRLPLPGATRGSQSQSRAKSPLPGATRGSQSQSRAKSPLPGATRGSQSQSRAKSPRTGGMGGLLKPKGGKEDKKR